MICYKIVPRVQDLCGAVIRKLAGQALSGALITAGALLFVVCAEHMPWVIDDIRYRSQGSWTPCT